MSLARRLREAREAAGLTLEELAEKAEVSKTYLWELEKDEAGEKKPSADVLLRVANWRSPSPSRISSDFPRYA